GSMLAELIGRDAVDDETAVGQSDRILQYVVERSRAESGERRRPQAHSARHAHPFGITNGYTMCERCWIETERRRTASIQRMARSGSRVIQQHERVAAEAIH